MAYPEVYKYSGKQPKFFQYPQEHEHQVKPRHTSPRELPNTHTKNNQPHTNENKCPIYVHQFTPVKMSPQYFYNQKPTSPRVRANNNNKTKNSRQMLDKLEESYWASWKPRRETETKISFTTKERVSPINNAHNPMKPYGDIEDTIYAYLTDRKYKYSDYPIMKAKENKPLRYNPITPKPIQEYSSVLESVTETYSVSDDKSSETLSNRFEVIYKATQPPISEEIHTQIEQIQKESTIIDTSPSPPEDSVVSREDDVATIFYKKEQTEQKSSTLINALSNIENKISHSTQSIANINEEYAQKEDNVLDENPAPEKLTEDETEQKREIIEHEVKESKILKHTDSLILAKKKLEENEDKEHYQQPKCIKLYRKHTVPVTTYSRGGTYPLKSCLRKESSFKGNFRLGAPGSNLFVSVGSFNKRRRY